MNKRLINKTLAIAMCLAIFVSSIPLEGISFAATTVTSVLYNTRHNAFDMDSGYLEIHGTELSSVTILLRDTDNVLFTPTTVTMQTDSIVLVDLTTEETKKFKGEMYVGAAAIDLELGTFPTIGSANSKNINYGDTENLTINGNNLDQVKTNLATGSVVAKFGKIQTSEFFNPAGDVNNITITNPVPPGGNGGFQDITFSRTTSSAATTVDVVYQYADVFRLVDNVGLNTPEMFPNIGAYGDIVYFTADNFNNTKNYNAYFLKDLAGGDDYNAVNRAEFIALSLDIDGTTQDKLTVKVPSKVALPADPNFIIGTYYVVLVNESDGQVIAEQVVNKPSILPLEPDEYTVIESSYNPQILSINPTSGTDNGGPVTIQGSNILEVDLPSLVDDNIITNVATINANSELVLTYNDGTYNGKPATIVRTIKIQIGKVVTFDTLDYSTGFIGEELLRVTTGSIPDALIDPTKDVQVEITTTVVETGAGGGTLGKSYVFRQTAIKENGFTFLPSTLEPIIDEIVPNTIQVTSSAGKYQLKEETLFVIKGNDFLVDRIVQGDGSVITRQPTVLIKKDKSDLSFDHYQVGFFPSDSDSGVNGIIRFRYDEVIGPSDILDLSGTPIELDLIVLDASGKVVDGTVGNDIGTKIVIRIPNISDQAPIQDIGIKQIQIINPKRGSAELGGFKMFIDKLELVETGDNPVIESVEPHVVTVEGGEEVVIIGSNLKEGMKLYLDGEEITTFTRESDPLGSKYIVTFTAPPGREGTTQLQVINPSGGMDVRDFIYVKSFNSDPEITNFTPTKGTATTLVVVNGDNYLKPDSSVADTKGVNGLRLLGTRVLLDGIDVNLYTKDINGDIEYRPYVSPVSTDSLLSFISDKAVWSVFEENVTVIKDGAALVDALFYLSNDSLGNPMITNRDGEAYYFTYNPTLLQYSAHSDAFPAGVVFTPTQPAANQTRLAFTLGGTAVSFTATMDNKVISLTRDEDGLVLVTTADYVDSIILERAGLYFTLSSSVNGDVVFTNGSDLKYVITENAGGFQGKEEDKPAIPVTVTENDLTIDGNTYTYITPYVIDVLNKRITGDRTKVINREQLSFIVPSLSTGTGFKDLVVINPDTKRAEKNGSEGFYYIAQSSSHPVISEITPNKGSIDGGYIIKITGSDFEDDMKVFIDSVLVSSADTYVALDGSHVTVKVPACIKDLQGDFGIDKLSVPVVVLNEDGGSAYKEDGFTYVVPISNPRIDSVILPDGSSNGGEIVEIIGYDFRFEEPYKDLGGSGPGYNPGDKFEDLYKNNIWDDLLDPSVDPGAVVDVPFTENPTFTMYKDSEILPTVFFGENEAKIVEYAKGYIKVIAPAHVAGNVPLYVVNNDQGVSNVMTYTYASSQPTITQISPDKGNRIGQELKDIYGSEFYRSEVEGYIDNNPDAIVNIPTIEAIVRFGDIDNREISNGQPNYGQINGGRSDVVLEGNLRTSYDGNANRITVSVEENGKTYQRQFNNYGDGVVYIPMEMLRIENPPASGTFNYYYPNGYSVANQTSWNNNIYEYIRVSIEDRRLIVERGHSPKVQYVSKTRLTATSPSYHTIDPVPLTVINNDGGKATATFTYTNPDSAPKIVHINPFSKAIDGTFYQVQGSIQGGIQIEVVGLDFRTGVKAFIGNKVATIVEDTTRVIDEITYDVLILTVPAGLAADVDQKYPVIIENPDAGMANSTTLTDLIGPNDGLNTLPFYFVYRKPLSGPVITDVLPVETSVFGGNTIVITGTDFRTGALVTIGTAGGVPITGGIITEEGTKLTIVTPTGMTLGDKTVQVINPDFGTGTKDNALKVVSFPTVEEEILTEDGLTSASVVNVEGGERIMVKGTGFFAGARVFFGGKRETYDEKPDGEVVGLFKDDTYIELKDAYEATGVTVVDENTMIITTPEITKEDTFNITVINADAGISEDNADIKFSEPIPTTPKGLRVRVIDDRYIQLYDYTSEGVEYYEVYYYLGRKSTSEIYKNDRQDMNYLGTTTLEPFKVNRIPGFEHRQKSDVLFFALKAVNKYGVSNWSGFAVLNFNQMEDIEELGPEDIDGDLGVPKGKDYIYDSDGVTSVINLSEKELPKQVTIDLRGQEDGTPGTRIINVPREMVESSQSLIYVDYLDSKLQFIPVGLNTPEFRELNFYDRAYGRITTSTAGNSYNSMLKLSLPRGKKTATRIFTLDVEAINNEESKIVNKFSAPMDLQLLYDDRYLSQEEEGTLQMYRYDKVLNKWELMSANVNRDRNIVTVRTSKPGSYVVLYNR